MILKKRTFWLISVAILLATVFLCGIFGIGAKAEQQGTPTFSEVQLAEEYKIGDTLTIPTVSVSQNGKDYECTSVVIMPDGSAVQKDTIVFEKSGTYTIVYKAVVDGKYVEKSVDFTVINDLYSVYNKQSSATWGVNSYLTTEGDFTEGINVSLKPDDVFTFNQVIDVSKMTKSDKIVKFYVTPTEKGTGEAASMYVKLTDIYDPNNYVLVHYSMRLSEITWSSHYIYASAGASGQDLVGYEWRNDDTYAAHINSWAGLRSWVSYTGQRKSPSEVAGNEALMAQLSKFTENYDYLSMDYANRTLHAKTQNHWRDYSMIVDLDDPNIYGANCWDGFTTGEVRMSIYFENYAGASANIFITEIANFDLTDFNFKDSVAPVIEVDYEGYTKDSAPIAFVGQPYKTFAGRAIDNLDENVQLKTVVYYNYSSDARVQCYIKDGYFTPKRAGKYTIVYTATDVLGNETVELLEIDCVQSNDTVKLQVEGDEKTVDIGETVRLNGYTVSANNGNYQVAVEAVLQTDDTVRSVIDLETMTFKPTQTGVYEIRYTVSDYTHTFTATDILTVNKSDTPIIGTYSEFPAYLIKGATYSLDAATAYDYSSGSKVEISADYYVVEDNGTAKKAENNSFTVSASDTVEILCKADNGKGEMSESLAVIPVVDVNYGDKIQMANYFQGEGFVSEASESAITYTKAFDGASEASLEFINRVLINQFTFTASFPEDSAAFEKFDVYFTDALDATSVLKITFAFASDKTVSFIVNDFEQKVYRTGYIGETANLNLFYQQSTNSLLINNNLTVALNTTGVFNGFNGGFASFKVNFTGVTGKVGCAISHVCNQPFNKGIDTIKPVVFLAEKTANLININEEFTIKSAEAFDLLDPSVTLTFKLMSFKGLFITSVDGVVLDGTQDPSRDYTVKLTDYGRYSLQYISKDSTGNRYEVQNLITVQDSVVPEITLNKGYQTQANVGGKIAIAKIAISDNVDETITTRCYVIAPNEEMISVELNGSFTAQYKGTYTVYYYAVDAAQNVAMVSYTVSVS